MLRLLFVFALFTPISFADSTDEIERYGQLPAYRDFAISPNGENVSFIRRGDEHDEFLIMDIAKSELIFGSVIDKFKARSTYFLTDDHVVLMGSDTTRTFGYSGKRESSGSLVYNIKANKYVVLLNKTKNIHPAQTGLGSVVGFNKTEQLVYMPAYDQGSVPKYNLYKVKLKNGRGRLHARGNSHTIDWFVSENGTVLAREEYNEKSQLHSIRSKLSGQWEEVFRQKTAIPSISVRAVGDDGESLLFVDSNSDRNAIYKMSLSDGAISGPEYYRDDADVDDLLLDVNRKLVSVTYSGFKPEHQFSDEKISVLFARLEVTFPASSVYLSSWTPDLKYFVILVSGGDSAGSYYLVDGKSAELMLKFASQYEVDAIGEIKTVRYKARDGLMIPSLLTLPPGEQGRKNLPLVAMPHGGPESYDQITFDWMAQYLAQKGYAVLQPNFRGSRGFGYEFRNAGRGKWGKEMQDDVSDGVAALVEAGYADPNRVCIIGSSYGGYSALAGGAFSPTLYRCVISISGVSDLPFMLAEKKNRYGSGHWVVSYWNKIIGDSKTEREKLKSISPINFVDQFQAPVLLIHGEDDTVVPIRQSKLMYKALKKAKKIVEFEELDGEDHWLSTSATRLQTLKAIDKFLDIHNPVELNSQTVH